MNNQEIHDFLKGVCHPLPVGSIAYWDWCNRVAHQLPANWLNTCQDVMDCVLVSPERTSLLLDVADKLDCINLASCSVFSALQDQVNNLQTTILAAVSFSVFTTQDSVTTVIPNNGQMRLTGLDWLRVLTQGADFVVWLPTTWLADNFALVWNSGTNQAEWRDPFAMTTGLIMNTMAPQISALSQQINTLAAMIPNGVSGVFTVANDWNAWEVSSITIVNWSVTNVTTI